MEGGHDDVIDVVVEWGADMNTRDASLNTALHVAAQNGHARTVKTLAKHGANFHVYNSCKVIPIFVACYRGY